MSSGVEARIIETRVWTPGLVTLRFDRVLEDFQPGQFVNIGLPETPTVRRAYSIASAPGAALEFYVAQVVGGTLSPGLCELLPGARLHLDATPQGFFTLKWLPSARDLWLFATGTGLGPYISMLRNGELFTRFENVVLVHGVRTAEQLGYAEELTALAQARSERFVYVPALSRHAGAGPLFGRLTQLLANGQLEQRAGLTLTPERAHVMLCGNPAMIDEMIALLGVRGLRRHRTRTPGHITIERYWD